MGLKAPLTGGAFLFGMSAHYFGLIRYAAHEGRDDLYWLKVAMNDPSFVLWLTLFAVAYLAGQVILWATFWRED